MRAITALFLLSSLLVFSGCNPAEQVAAEVQPQPGQSAEATVERFDETPATDTSASPPPDSSPSTSTGGEESLSSAGPDPLTGTSEEPQGLKSSAAKKTEVWINFYYLRGNELSDRELQRLIGWSHQKGLTIGTPGEKDFLYTHVRLIDWVTYSDKIKRNLIYDGNDRVYLPTLVFLDSQGRELCHNVGQINMRHLDEDFDKFSRKPSSRKMGGEDSQATVKQSFTVGDSADWICGPNGCRPRK